MSKYACSVLLYSRMCSAKIALASRVVAVSRIAQMRLESETKARDRRMRNSYEKLAPKTRRRNILLQVGMTHVQVSRTSFSYECLVRHGLDSSPNLSIKTLVA